MIVNVAWCKAPLKKKQESKMKAYEALLAKIGGKVELSVIFYFYFLGEKQITLLQQQSFHQNIKNRLA